MLNETDKYLSIDQCVHGMLYLIDSRNLRLGVYNKNTTSFYGIRTKFGSRFIDDEYSWDLGPPFGTCKPIKCLEAIPASLSFVSGQVVGTDDSVWKHQQVDKPEELFAWLDQKLVEYKEEIDKL